MMCARPAPAEGVMQRYVQSYTHSDSMHFLWARCALFALFIVIHALIPTFLFFKIPSFMIFNMAHLSSSYLAFFTGISCLN